MSEAEAFRARLSAVLARVVPGRLGAIDRLSGGANMESWSIDWAAADGMAHGFILRRAPSATWSAGRPFGLATEAAIVRAAHAGGVRAPEVVAVLSPEDGLGEGYLMVRVDAAVNPATIIAEAAPTLIADIARELARIHALTPEALPSGIPVMDTRAALAELEARFEAYGGDRPIIALALRWLDEHVPPPAPLALTHGDLRMGNIMATPAGLAAVLDWELAHWGDAHEDLAYGCMTVWRFGAIDRPAFGLASLDAYFAAYERHGGQRVDRARFDFWLVYRTLWWALGCLQMGQFWRSGSDASLERAVIARRTSENELDLLLLLEAALPAERLAAERVAPPDATLRPPQLGETSAAELIGAVADWLASDVKARASGRDKFMAAVAINALGMVRRELDDPVVVTDRALAADLRQGRVTLETPGVLALLRSRALAKLANDVPKYAALGVARQRWTLTD